MSVDNKRGGVKPIDVIRELLKGNSFDAAVGKLKNLPPPSADGVNDPVIAWLYKNSEPGQRVCVKVGRKSAQERMQSGLRLFVNPEKGGDGEWYIRPILLQPKRLKEANWHGVEIAEPWITGLLRCVEIVFNKCYVACDEGEGSDTLAQARGFNARVWKYRREGDEAFFPDPKILEEWIFLSHWDDWQRKGVKKPEQEAQMAELDHAITSSSYSRLRRKTQVAKTRKRGETQK